jgi:hypothetical protein
MRESDNMTSVFLYKNLLMGYKIFKHAQGDDHSILEDCKER